jgi:outer membrane cobalamin receptor
VLITSFNLCRLIVNTIFFTSCIANALLNVGLLQVKSENTTNKLKHTSQDLFINWQKNINDLDINAGLRYIKHNKFGPTCIFNSIFFFSSK